MSEQTVTVMDLLKDIDAARARMSRSNPHRNLLERCGVGLIEMTQRAYQAEQGTRKDAAADVEGVPV